MWQWLGTSFRFLINLTSFYLCCVTEKVTDCCFRPNVFCLNGPQTFVWTVSVCELSTSPLVTGFFDPFVWTHVSQFYFPGHMAPPCDTKGFLPLHESSSHWHVPASYATGCWWPVAGVNVGAYLAVWRRKSLPYLSSAVLLFWLCEDCHIAFGKNTVMFSFYPLLSTRLQAFLEFTVSISYSPTLEQDNGSCWIVGIKYGVLNTKFIIPVLTCTLSLCFDFTALPMESFALLLAYMLLNGRDWCPHQHVLTPHYKLSQSFFASPLYFVVYEQSSCQDKAVS